SCSGAEELCGAQCFDTQTDLEHCGRCDVVCSHGAEPACCAATCTDVAVDAQNCGACGAACPTADYECRTSGGSSACACKSSALTDCGDGCFDLTSTGAHCGSCEVACTDGKTCQSSACKCPSNEPDDCGTCTDVTTDPNNCSACSVVCTGHKVCSASACVCPEALPNDCDGTCVNEANDPHNCGGCGQACTGNRVCVNSACVCPTSDPDLCDGVCTDTATDPQNCGGCGAACDPGDTCDHGCFCAGSPCTLVSPQCGCPVGEGCVASTDGSGAVACTQTGSGTFAHECSTDADCASGFVCLQENVNGTPTGVSWCRKYCAADADCPAPGGCVETESDAASSVLTCSEACDPVAQTGCAPGTVCSAASVQQPNMTVENYTYCHVPGAGPAGAACVYDTDCQAGDFCSAFGTCIAFCDPAHSACPSNQICSPSFSTVDGRALGVCVDGCDALTNTGCSGGAVCNLFEDPTTSAWYSECTSPAGSGTSGAACSSFLDCARGYGCLGSTTFQCLRYCDTASSCASGPCTPLAFNPVIPATGGVAYGECP
ncbi:MAG TPA: hypothetical protein VGM56_26535, partial [Byssovorax sp.]